LGLTRSSPAFNPILDFNLIHQEIFMSTTIHNNDFVPPLTVAEARDRLAEINTAIDSIADQIKIRELENALDPEWLKRATYSRKFKVLEARKLDNWIANMEDDRKGYRTLNDAIIDVIRDEFAPEEWDGIVEEARASIGGVAP
jgi:hypothetical protein